MANRLRYAEKAEGPLGQTKEPSSVGAVGFEPTRPCEPADLKSAVSTGFHHAPISERSTREIGWSAPLMRFTRFEQGLVVAHPQPHKRSHGYSQWIAGISRTSQKRPAAIRSKPSARPRANSAATTTRNGSKQRCEQLLRRNRIRSPKNARNLRFGYL